MMLFYFTFGMRELFNFFTTVFVALWLVNFLYGQTTFKGEFSFIVFIMLFKLIYGVFTHGHCFVPHAGLWLVDNINVHWLSRLHLCRTSLKKQRNISSCRLQTFQELPAEVSLAVRHLLSLLINLRIQRRHHLFEMRSLRPSHIMVFLSAA